MANFSEKSLRNLWSHSLLVLKRRQSISHCKSNYMVFDSSSLTFLRRKVYFSNLRTLGDLKELCGFRLWFILNQKTYSISSTWINLVIARKKQKIKIWIFGRLNFGFGSKKLVVIKTSFSDKIMLFKRCVQNLNKIASRAIVSIY